MSLITQCPACATMFRVVPDQLRISEGWVRCGHCDEVFDANAQLRTSVDMVQNALTAAAPEEPMGTHPKPEAESEQKEANAAYDWGPIVQPPYAQPQPEPAPLVESSHLQGAMHASASVPAGEAVLDANGGHEYEGHREPFFEPGPPAALVPDDAAVSQSEPLPIEDWAFQAPGDSGLNIGAKDTAETSADEVSLSFMPRAASPTWWGRLSGTKSMMACCGLLLLLFASQFVVFQRDRIAAMVPAVRPALLAACAVMDCKISAPRQIESIVIDSSAFTSVKAGIYLLNVTLKNAAALDVAVPALELTLTDMQDRSLLRWVVQPHEYSSQQNILAAGAEIVASLPIAVRAGAATEKIAGYKLLAFYP